MCNAIFGWPFKCLFKVLGMENFNVFWGEVLLCGDLNVVSKLMYFCEEYDLCMFGFKMTRDMYIIFYVRI